MRYLPLAFLLFLLSGCATPEERADRAYRRFSPHCEKLGYKDGTEDFRQCMLRMYDAASRQSRGGAGMTCNTIGTTTTCN